ncbi:hypothetical protein CVS42_06255 [Aeromonas veronii]|nr:hypothetical protein CVS42_06255 [Aeromonas veronii]
MLLAINICWQGVDIIFPLNLTDGKVGTFSADNGNDNDKNMLTMAKVRNAIILASYESIGVGCFLCAGSAKSYVLQA